MVVQWTGRETAVAIVTQANHSTEGCPISKAVVGRMDQHQSATLVDVANEILFHGLGSGAAVVVQHEVSYFEKSGRPCCRFVRAQVSAMPLSSCSSA
ncbi:MAG: hypothetical protein M2R45_04609 [Verrucomicrobia subdivision 3 bacterium]|nr:hypothetical protein [Limisphaerales bacterium]MCS1417328.1 hypothetical protein [Limisphaerales bacterium]